MAIFGDDRKTKEMSAEIASGISEIIADSIAKTMQPVFEALTGKIEQSLTATQTQQQKAAADMAETIRGLEKLTEAYASAMQTMQQTAAKQQEMIASIGELVNRQADTQKSLTQECENVFAGVRDTQNKLASLYSDIGSGATALVAREEGVVKNQKKVLDKAAEDLIALQEKWTQNFGRANDSLTANYDRMFKQLEAASASVEKYASALDASTAALSKAYADFEADMGKGNTSYRASLEESTQAHIKMLNESVEGTFSLIDKQLAAAVESLGKTANEIAEAAQRLPKAIRGLQ